jgi:hypothetical protein
VEEHLMECSRCVRDFIALKREIETAESSPRPSALARQRLRRAVAQEVGATNAPRRRAWWERPLAVGYAAAVVLGAFFAMHAMATQPGSAPHSQSAMVAQ